jgi:hypothetical protein
MARPAGASRVVDEVVEGELAAGSDVSTCDDIDSITTEAQVDVAVARVVEVAVGSGDEKEAAVDQSAVLRTLPLLGSKR